MESFLEKLAGHIITSYPDTTGNLSIVLPNRRSGLFLKKHLARLAGKNIWAPKVYAIEDFFFELSGYTLIDQLTLLFELYEIHSTVSGKGQTPFENFLDWGSALLDDFNEIDLYLVNARELFQYLSEAKAIERWHPDGTPLTAVEKDYLKFYRSLGEYYRKLVIKLDKKNLAYNGMAYRKLVSDLPAVKAMLGNRRVIFAGFNAFSRSEEVIIQYMLEEEIAEIFWDADVYYVNDRNQEAGKFLNHYFKNWSSRWKDWIGDQFLSGRKEIHITGVPKNISQAKYCGQLIDELLAPAPQQPSAPAPNEHPEPEKIAIVLADETLLIPVLHSLPASIRDLNITMGYPLVNTSVGLLLQDIFRMQENVAYRLAQHAGKPYFYIKDVNRILLHPLMHYFFDPHLGDSLGEVFLKFRGTLMASRKAFYAPQELISSLPQEATFAKEFFEILFSPWSNPADGIQKVKSILENLKNILIKLKPLSGTSYDLEIEYLFHFSLLFNKLSGLLERYPIVDSIKAFRKVFQQTLQSHRLPFTGEPLKGIQIMGMLETRALDFDTIIILSVNENILPAGKNYHSFIPFDIKFDFGLPTHREKESIYAYHFYRLLQRATTVHLLYNTEGNDLRGGEKSRFIHQLLLELPKNSKINIVESVLQMPDYKPESTNSIAIDKSSEVMQSLIRKAEEGFSPTSLSTFISCPLKFYLLQIAGIREAEEFEETIDAATLGEVVHKALQILYSPYVLKEVRVSDIEKMLQLAEETVNTAFSICYRDGDLRFGKNHLIRRVAQLMTKNYLSAEKSLLTKDGSAGYLKIVALERQEDVFIPLAIKGKEVKVKLKGRADRVDELNGRLRITDYKTGSVYPKEIKVNSWEDLASDPNLAKGFQLLVYQYLFHGKIGIGINAIESGIFSLRMPSKGLQVVTTPSDNDPAAVHSEIEEVLISVLERIFDPEVPFSQTDDLDQCKYCPFLAICNR